MAAGQDWMIAARAFTSAAAVTSVGSQRQDRFRIFKPGVEDMQLDKTIPAVVTGGASGLGAATARALAGKGVRVALLDLNADAGEKLAKELGGTFAK